MINSDKTVITEYNIRINMTKLHDDALAKAAMLYEPKTMLLPKHQSPSDREHLQPPTPRRTPHCDATNEQ